MPTALAVAALLLVLAVQASGCLGLIRAGRLESRGELAASRALARRGGLRAAGASVAASVVSLALALLLGPLGRGVSTPSFLVALGLLLFGIPLSGLAALLAGLSGKPRPTGRAAAALLALAIGALAFVIALS